jgi:hypothetical protein
MNSGILIGIIFSVSLGVLGGAIGTYFSVKNTSGPRERAFMIRVSIFTWIAVSIFVAALMFLPKPYNWLLWIPYGIALPLTIIRWNKSRWRFGMRRSSARAERLSVTCYRTENSRSPLPVR